MVSIDWGGWFSRETDFFQKFDTHIVRTNFRRVSTKEKSLNLSANDWRFMGCGALLLADSLNAAYNAFGSILEATSSNFNKTRLQPNAGTSPFLESGMANYNPVQGITEIGTAMIVLKNHSADILRGSLASLADSNSEKYKRKEHLLRAVGSKYNYDLSFLSNAECGHKVKFGDYFASDFLCIYIIKRLGLSAAQDTVTDIPNEALELASQLHCDFYERFNPCFLDSIPEEFRPFYLSKLAESGIIPYTKEDWNEFDKVNGFLKSIHHY